MKDSSLETTGPVPRMGRQALRHSVQRPGFLPPVPWGLERNNLLYEFQKTMSKLAILF